MADPQTIGRYVVDGTLGRGAMGVIYRAHDPDIDRPVAIKLIRADLLDGDDRADFIARFRREAQAAGRCMHPNIVAVYDFALHDGNPFLAMEFVDGVTLAEALQRGVRPTPAEATAMMLQVLAALEAAHARGVVHRDIKPANIMLAGGSRVKVTDFGISRLESSSLTQGAMIGTPSYMSPEQCRSETVDARSDLFSAGVVLYELLTGAKPFQGATVAQVFTRLLHDDAPDVGLACPAAPPSLRAAVAKALAKSPDDRFPTAAAMAAALHAATGPAASDLTIVVPDRAPATPAAFDEEVLATLERKLTEHVGPIARFLVQSAVRSSASLELLCASLASRIDAPAQRAAFERDALREMGRTTTTTTGRSAILPPGSVPLGALPPETLDQAAAALARHVGPVARILVKRAAARAPSATALWQTLATHIDDEKARAAFLAEAPK